MYKSTKELKAIAREALSGKWMLAVALSFLTGIVTFSFSSSDGTMTFTSIIGTILSTILKVGFLSFLLKLCCGQKDQAVFTDIFYGFKNYPGKAILLYLLEILYYLPGVILYAVFFAASFIFFRTQSGTPGVACILVCLALTILFMIYTLYIALTYGMVYYLLLDYPDLSVMEIWKRSAQIMKGNRKRLFFLDLSFLPWMFASIFTCGIALLWVSVYISTTETAFYLDLIQTQTIPSQGYHESTVPEAETTTYNYSGIDKETFK